MLKAAEFDQIVERALARIPRSFRHRLDNVAIVVEPEGSSPNLLGLYQGVPLSQRSSFDSFRMPDRITIYQRPHERLAKSPDDLERLVTETVWHEVAHYFGMNEREVRTAERKRGHDTLTRLSGWRPGPRKAPG